MTRTWKAELWAGWESDFHCALGRKRAWSWWGETSGRGGRGPGPDAQGLHRVGLSGRECSSRKSCTSRGRGARSVAVWGQATEQVLGLLVNAGSQHRPEEVRGLVSSVNCDLESVQVIP